MEAQAEHRKGAKYAALKASHHFVPFGVERAWSGSTQPRLGPWAMPAPGNKGGTQQGVTPLKNCHCSTEGECSSSARDRREAGRPLLGMANRALSPFYYCYCL